jgi:hypothetical protein
MALAIKGMVVWVIKHLVQKQPYISEENEIFNSEGGGEMFFQNTELFLTTRHYRPEGHTFQCSTNLSVSDQKRSPCT